ncbi:hypothetical protein LSG31_18395 [Fodinisporobacter ferrooxydans]|uniref:Uncharacterized protein n=1 Tax=Fodinisporobacter ferrooxydans TaxID=2901836 RepID=A0ABY4CR42_9BACL|nr:hypothetical protein LSG31_18395 [Alicyclobacillaceae bacterium MYW30-H2]
MLKLFRLLKTYRMYTTMVLALPFLQSLSTLYPPNLMSGSLTARFGRILHAIREADLIVIMKNGSAIEQGNHQELLAKHGFHAELHQLGKSCN